MSEKDIAKINIFIGNRKIAPLKIVPRKISPKENCTHYKIVTKKFKLTEKCTSEIFQKQSELLSIAFFSRYNFFLICNFIFRVVAANL